MRRVVIAGGGTAGWTVAAALVKELGPLLTITLVESDEIGSVGVGESTIPTARGFHDLLGISEQAFMAATGASIKLGISFENWSRIGDRYFHPFGITGRGTWMAGFQHYWLEARRAGLAGAYAEYSAESYAAASGRFAKGQPGDLAYAYHLDAVAYARFLRTLAEPAGVLRVEGKIVSVELDGETGDVTALRLDRGERVEGDLFLDCTGFRALLMNAVGARFDDWSHWLMTDSALAVQSEGGGKVVPYTRAIAHPSGWRWRIPLQHRVGNGIVYASAFLDVDGARNQLLAGLDGVPLTEPRLVRYVTGHRPEPWTGNCIALGLAAGFIEPLESTSIHLIQTAVTRLLQSFPLAGVAPAIRARFNAVSSDEWAHVRDFVILHYHATERDDSPFWKACRTMVIPDSLGTRLDAWREGAHAWQTGEDLFRTDSWAHVALGQRIMPHAWHELARAIPETELGRVFESLAAGARRRVADLPDLGEFLRRYAPAEMTNYTFNDIRRSGLSSSSDPG
ncbi:tryptophan halogenase family protein [Sphingomonas melonis]|uniref:Tryptophan halogenase n=1 Tax=Sphingomonas melonis TaxID=152682 RepID=A0A7Y9FN41_9SPHN|nr:tryptophan halogenase [Sphingomonas melonis]